MYRVYFLLILLIFLYFITNTPESFSNNILDNTISNNVSNTVNKDLCPIQGTIEQLDNPAMDSCYRGYYIPYLFNVGDYITEVPI